MPVIVALIALLFTSSAFAQNCRVGCPCGNTCISCADVCRVGGGTATRDGGGTVDPLTPVIVIGSVAALTCLVALPLIVMASQTQGGMSLPQKSFTPTHPVRFLLEDQCGAVDLDDPDADVVVATGCSQRWVCTRLAGSWTCSEPQSAPSSSRPLSPKRSTERSIQEAFQ